MWWHTRRNQISSFGEKRTSPFKSAGASVQSTTGSGDVRNSGSNAGYTTFRSGVKSTGYPIHSPVSPSLPLPCVTVCHHISTGLYNVHWHALHCAHTVLMHAVWFWQRTALTALNSTDWSVLGKVRVCLLWGRNWGCAVHNNRVVFTIRSVLWKGGYLYSY